MGGSSDLEIDVTGKGGHAAKPDLTIDPLYIASQIIVALQSVVSRSISPSQSAVVSITQMEASDRRNIIANKARMAGTIRWFDNQTRELIEERIESIAKGIAASFGAEAEVLIRESTIPVNNQTYISNICRKKLEDMRVDIEELVVDSHYRTNLSEDFAYIIDRIPGAMLLIGAGQKVDGKIHPHHHSKFDIDEKAMTLAIAALFETIKALT